MTKGQVGGAGTGAEGLHVVSVRTAAYYAIQYPETGLNQDTRSLVVLHGWGQSSASFMRKFASLKHHNILVVAPQAPHQFYLDQATRKVGFGWLTSFDRDRGVATAVTALDSIFREIEEALGFPFVPVVLGFSQGVSMAWRYAALGACPVAGVVACGGDFPADVEAVLAARGPVPTMLVHGTDDVIVPIAKGNAAECILAKLGYVPETLYFSGGHEVPEALLTRLPIWIETAAQT